MTQEIYGVAMQTPCLLEKNENCLDCGEAIFNPICPECISDWFKQWVGNYPLLEKKVMGKLKKFLKSYEDMHDKSQYCISCKRDNAYLCPYCFTEFLVKMMKGAKIGGKVLNEFLFLFNFDLEHTGYAKEGLTL